MVRFLKPDLVFDEFWLYERPASMLTADFLLNNVRDLRIGCYSFPLQNLALQAPMLAAMKEKRPSALQKIQFMESF